MPDRASKRWNLKDLRWVALWLALLVLALAWRAQNLDAFSPVNDEGAYLMWAKLAVDGYPLYTETRAVQPPLFFEWIGLAFWLGGQTVQAARWAILLGFIPFAVALSWLAHRAGGWPAALSALLLLGIAPIIFTFSRLVMAEVPATGLAVVSLALLFLFLDREAKFWLVASGLVLGISLLLKGLNPFVAGPVLLLLALRHAERGSSFVWREWLFETVLWTFAVLLPILVVWLLYDSAAMYDQVITFRRDLRAAISGSWSDTWDQFVGFLANHWGFWLLAFGGIISTVLRARAGRVNRTTGNSLHWSYWLYPVVWLVWLGAGSAMLAWHTPLFPHHFVVLLPPLILLGAGFVADLLAMWRFGLSTLPARILLSLLLVAAIFNLPAAVRANQHAASIVTGGREAEALTLLRAVSQPNDFLMGDSQLLIFMAGRRTPPPLGDVALVAIKAGRQTSERMIELTRRYQAPAVVQWSLRLPWLPDYLAWVDANYLAHRVWDNDHTVYFAPRMPADQPVPNERLDRLGDSLALRGYELDRPTIAAGDNLQLRLFWQLDAPLAEDYTVFTQLLDSQGGLVAGWDSQPLGGYLPTSQWPVNELVTDRVQLPLPADLPAGEYRLITGLYLLDTLERLKTPAGDDFTTLSTITVE